NYGGPLPTMALLPGSPAIGAGASISGITTDERGFSRPAGAIDIGAFQSQSNLVVNTAADNDAAGQLTLRDAINLANALGGGTITFAPSLAGQTITLTSGELPRITSNVTIDATGVANLAVSGGGNFRVFDIAQNAAGSITGLTIEDGNGISGSSNPSINSYDENGGAIYNSGTLTVSTDTFTGNTAPGAVADGGAIYCNLQVTLNVVNS